MTMKNRIFSILGLLSISVLSYGQTALTATTLTRAVSPTTTTFYLTSATNVLNPAPNGSNRTVLFIDREALFVNSVVGNVVTVTRGVKGTLGNVGHIVNSVVYVGPDDDRHFTKTIPIGSCTSTTIPFLPVIDIGTGKAWTCNNAGRWGAISSFYVPPTQCTFAPTTSTVTNTYPQIGASNIFVLNGTSNSAAGTTTLTCTILVPTNVTTNQGSQLVDITTFVGSQTTAPTSLGTATLGSITFPAAATSETASTVTPVAAGGTVTTVSPTQITTVTTAGSFLTLKHTFGTAIMLSTDNQVLQYTMPFLQSAAAVMTLNTPGLIVHYVESPNISVN